MFTLLPVIVVFLSRLCVGVELKYMSFWEYVPADFGGWCNFAVSNNVTEINEGFKLNITHLYDVTYTFFKGSGNLCNTSYGTVLDPLILNPDYQTLWDRIYATVDELYYVNKSIFGFFMGDELVWRGLSPVSLQFATKFLRENISDSIIYTNGATPPMQNDIDSCGNIKNYTQISPYLDWFSIDLYHHNGTAVDFVNETVKPFYEQYVYTKMNLSYQYALCVPGSYSSNYNSECDEQCYDKMCAVDANNFYLWGMSDDRIIGLYPWHWMNVNGKSVYNVGTVDMNLTKQTWNAIGKDIISK